MWRQSHRPAALHPDRKPPHRKAPVCAQRQQVTVQQNLHRENSTVVSEVSSRLSRACLGNEQYSILRTSTGTGTKRVFPHVLGLQRVRGIWKLRPCRQDPGFPAQEKRIHSIFECLLSLCLSRACLGTMMHFIHKWHKRWRFSLYQLLLPLMLLLVAPPLTLVSASILTWVGWLSMLIYIATTPPPPPPPPPTLRASIVSSAQ
jgi:hypothetical protein